MTAPAKKHCKPWTHLSEAESAEKCAMVSGEDKSGVTRGCGRGTG